MPKYTIQVHFQPQTITVDTADFPSEEKEGFDLDDVDVAHDFLRERLENSPEEYDLYIEIDWIKIEKKV